MRTSLRLLKKSRRVGRPPWTPSAHAAASGPLHQCGDARWSLFSSADPKPCGLCGGEMKVERRMPGPAPAGSRASAAERAARPYRLTARRGSAGPIHIELVLGASAEVKEPRDAGIPPPPVDAPPVCVTPVTDDRKFCGAVSLQVFGESEECDSLGISSFARRPWPPFLSWPSCRGPPARWIRRRLHGQGRLPERRAAGQGQPRPDRRRARRQGHEHRPDARRSGAASR